MKIAILSSYTANNIEPFLKKKLDCEIKFGGFNQYVQDLIDKNSWLHKYNPDIIAILLSTSTLFPNIEYGLDKDIEKLIDDKFSNLIDAIDQYPEAMFIVTNLEHTTYSPYGISDMQKKGMHFFVNSWNEKLKEAQGMRSNLLTLDFEKVTSNLGKQNITDQKMFYLGKILLTLKAAEELANEIAKYTNAIYGIRKKCIVTDLDNTLWGGIIGEDGIKGIVIDDSNMGSIYQDVQKILLNYKKSGILLAISSKNNLKDAEEAINKKGMILKDEDFIIKKVNWEPKSKNIKEIAKELNIGLDSIVFLDDNPAERLEVKAHIPEVEVIDFPNDIAELPSILKKLPYFEAITITEEDKKRHHLYQQEKKRSSLKQTMSMEDYLKELQIEITIEKNGHHSIDRITQLINKTNQFNLRTKRYTKEEVSKFMHDPKSFVLSMRVEDKFGDLGLTGVIIVKNSFIDTFLMSCRIIGRNIEKQFFNEMMKIHKGPIEAEYIPTEKNEIVKDFYEQLGFSITKNNKNKLYTLSHTKIKDFDYIKVK